MEIYATGLTVAFSKAYPGIWKVLETGKGQIRGGKHPSKYHVVTNMWQVQDHESFWPEVGRHTGILLNAWNLREHGYYHF